MRKRKAAQDIEAQLAALEAQLRQENREVEVPVLESAGFEQEIQGMAAD